MVGVLGDLLTRARPPDEVAAGEGQRARGDEPVAIRKQQEARFDHRQNAGDRREGGGEERHQDGSDGDGGRRDGLVLDDLLAMVDNADCAAFALASLPPWPLFMIR